MQLACPRCANRSLEIREDPEGGEALWCSICYTAWVIKPAWGHDTLRPTKIKEDDINE